MRIIFMGTPEFAIPSLKALVESGHDVVLVITQPDKPKGRGKKLAAPPVKEYALEQGIDIFQPEKIKNDSFVDKIRDYNPDVLVTCAYGKILSKDALDVAPFGCINVHASLLPKYRGSAPIAWSIINGESETGVTTMYTDVGMDTGDILLKEVVPLDDEITTGELEKRLSVVGANLLIKTLEQLVAGTLKRIPQDNDKSSYAPMIDRNEAIINWNSSAKNICNLVRGMDPWPTAFTFYEDNRVKVWKSSMFQGEFNELDSESDFECMLPGTIISADKNGLFVKTGEGILQIHEIQVDSSKRMSVASYLLGHSIEPNVVLGERRN